MRSLSTTVDHANNGYLVDSLKAGMLDLDDRTAIPRLDEFQVTEIDPGAEPAGRPVRGPDTGAYPGSFFLSTRTVCVTRRRTGE
jgi:hypothetical protein